MSGLIACSFLPFMPVWMPMAAEKEEAVADAMEMLERVCATVEQLHTISMLVEAEEEQKQLLGGTDAGQNRAVRMQVLMGDGGRFCLNEFYQGKRVATIVNDGETITECDWSRNRWTRYPASWREKYAFSLLLLKSFPLSRHADSWVAGTQSAYRRWLSEVFVDAKVKCLGTKLIDGTLCDVLSGKKTKQDGAIYLSLGVTLAFDHRTHLPVSLVSTVNATMAGIPFISGKNVFTYQKVSLNVPVSAEDFAFDLPEDCKFLDPVEMRPERGSQLDGHPAPNVEFIDLEGEKVSLADCRKQGAVLLVFWATWCMPCKQELADLEVLLKEFPPPDFRIVAVGTDSAGTLKKFLEQRPLPFTVVHASYAEMETAFDVRSLPHTVLIDKTGTVVKTWRGWHAGGGSSEERIEEIRQTIKKPGRGAGKAPHPTQPSTFNFPLGTRNFQLGTRNSKFSRSYCAFSPRYCKCSAAILTSFGSVEWSTIHRKSRIAS